jgi:hypothetical protein
MTSPTTGLDAMVFRPFKNMPFAGTIAVIIGALAAALFAVSWFRHIAGNDGFIRFYEQLYGLSILAAWMIATAVGVWVARGLKLKPWAKIFGTGLIVAASLGMVLICIKTVTHIRYMDFPAKSTATLLEIAGRPDAEARDAAIQELGVRKVSGAVPLLCNIVENRDADRADRSSAANALGKICEHSCPDHVDVNKVLNVLIAALQNEPLDPYGDVVVYQAAWALGQIRDPRAVVPLRNMVCNKQFPPYVWEEAIRALGTINGAEARKALESARGTCTKAETRDVIDHVLKLNSRNNNE